MQCPTCPDATLVMTDRQGVEIDYCPKCRGVWLDRGELDKIIERSAGPAASPEPARQSRPEPHRDDRTPYRSDDRGRDDRSRHPSDDRRDQPRRKRGGLLEELFDF
jgi:hypothetical protein